MTTMKISDRDASYTNSNNFSFPNNPASIVPRNQSKKEIIPIPYQSVLPFLDFETVTPISLTWTGTFSGASRDTNMRKLSNWVYSKNLKRFWISDTVFIYFLGGTLRPSLIGTKNNFIDYVITLNCPIPFWYSGTESTYTVTTIGATATTLNDATSNSTGAFTNAGYAPAHIRHITVERTNGTITGFVFGDKNISSTSVDGDNIISWTETGTGILANEIMHFFLFYHVGQKCDKWYYFKTGDNADAGTYGTATAGGNATLTDTGQSGNWTTDEYEGEVVFIKSGTGVGQMRRIASNTTTVLTLERNWDTNPDATSVYSIGPDSTTFGSRDFDGDAPEDGPRVKSITTDQAFSGQITGSSTPQGTITCYYNAANWVK